MAIDTTKLGTIYSTLNNITKTTLNEQWNSRRLRGEDYASVVAQTITALIQTSASLVEAEATLAEQARQAAAELAEKQIEFNANLAEKRRQFDAELTSNAPVKTAQKALIDKQVLTEVNQASLIARQATAYDDKKRIAKAEVLNQKEGMYAAGGTAIPAELTTASLNAANAI